MDERSRERSRSKFSRRTYFTFLLFLAVALCQWVLITMFEEARSIFQGFQLYCSITFFIAAMLFGVFIFVKVLRSQFILNWVLTLVIVELLIFSMFVLASRSWLPDLVAFFFISLVAIIVALIIGCNLSFSMDMTEYLAPLFVTSFILVSASMYFLNTHMHVQETVPYAFLIFELTVSAVMLLFVMVHAQTIKGDRLIQMSTDDSLLAALLLFHEFLAIYALTFYWQIHYRYFTPDDIFWMSHSTTTTTTGRSTFAPYSNPYLDRDPVYNDTSDEFDIDDMDFKTKPGQSAFLF